MLLVFFIHMSKATWVSQRLLHNAPIFRLLLKVAVNGTHQCDFPNFCGQQCPTDNQLSDLWGRGGVGMLLIELCGCIVCTALRMHCVVLGNVPSFSPFPFTPPTYHHHHPITPHIPHPSPFSPISLPIIPMQLGAEYKHKQHRHEKGVHMRDIMFIDVC